MRVEVDLATSQRSRENIQETIPMVRIRGDGEEEAVAAQGGSRVAEEEGRLQGAVRGRSDRRYRGRWNKRDCPGRRLL